MKLERLQGTQKSSQEVVKVRIQSAHTIVLTDHAEDSEGRS